MSEISVIGNAVVGTVRATAPPAPTAPTSSVEVVTPPTEQGVAVPADRVEFSHQAQMLDKINQLPSVRQDRIDVIKDAIASDTFLTNDRLDVAFDRLIDEIIW